MENQIMIREDYNVDQVIDRVKAVKKLYESVMEKDQHYGTIPGTSKPTLYKAGAEKILAMFSLAAKTEKTEIRELADGHREYIITIGLYKKESSDFWGDGSGSCSTMETKYKHSKNIADIYNTVLKMAEKRAMVAAVLKATGVSDIFTQDLEDMTLDEQQKEEGEYILDDENAPSKEQYAEWKKAGIQNTFGKWKKEDDGWHWYSFIKKGAA